MRSAAQVAEIRAKPLTPEKLEHARTSREVATALALYLTGQFRARLMMFGNVVRTALTKLGNDAEGLADLTADAILFGQCVEIHMLGLALPNPATFPSGVNVALSRAIDNIEPWVPVIRTLTGLLLRDGQVSSSQFNKYVENCDNNTMHKLRRKLKLAKGSSPPLGQ